MDRGRAAPIFEIYGCRLCSPYKPWSVYYSTAGWIIMPFCMEVQIQIQIFIDSLAAQKPNSLIKRERV